MKRMFLAVMLVPILVGVFGDVPRALAYPEPAVVNRSWQLEFDYGHPRPIAVRDAQDELRWYWYMPYTVSNPTGESRLFVPEVTIATDTGAIFPANANVPRRVFQAIQRETRNDLLLDPIQIVGRLQPGSDYAKDGVLMWPDFEGDVDSFRVFIAGLSGENATVQNPVTGEDVLMQRTRMLVYRTPGSATVSPEDQPVVLETETDVMR